MEDELKTLRSFVHFLARRSATAYDFQDIVDQAEKSILGELKMGYETQPLDEESAALLIRALSRRTAKALRDEFPAGSPKKVVKERFDKLHRIIFSLPEDMTAHGVNLEQEKVQHIFEKEFQAERMDHLLLL